jgi:hypothetical protein
MFSSLDIPMALSHQVYGKKTHTDKYLNVSSHHHPAQKFVVLKTLISYAIYIYAPQFLTEENTHLSKALFSNRYSLTQINQAFRSAYKPKPKTSPPSSPPRALLTLPYVQDTNNHIAKLLAQKNIKMMFKPHKTLK